MIVCFLVFYRAPNGGWHGDTQDRWNKRTCLQLFFFFFSPDGGIDRYIRSDDRVWGCVSSQHEKQNFGVSLRAIKERMDAFFFFLPSLMDLTLTALDEYVYLVIIHHWWSVMMSYIISICIPPRSIINLYETDQSPMDHTRLAPLKLTIASPESCTWRIKDKKACKTPIRARRSPTSRLTVPGKMIENTCTIQKGLGYSRRTMLSRSR